MVSWLDYANSIANGVSGVYTITNLLNNKIYVGISTNLKFRIRSHYHKLMANKHVNCHLQASVNKHGISKFKVEIIELASESELLIREQTYQQLHKTTEKNFGYNILSTDINGKLRHTEAHKVYMSKLMKGKPKSEEHKKKLSQANAGRPGHSHTEAHKLHMSKIMSGRPKSEEHKKKLSQARTLSKRNKWSKV